MHHRAQCGRTEKYENGGACAIPILVRSPLLVNFCGTVIEDGCSLLAKHSRAEVLVFGQ